MQIASSWDDPDMFVDIKPDRIKYPDPKISIVVRWAFEKGVPFPLKETLHTPCKGLATCKSFGPTVHMQHDPYGILSTITTPTIVIIIIFVIVIPNWLRPLLHQSQHRSASRQTTCLRHMVWHWFGSEMHRPLHRPALKDMMC